MRKNNLRGCMFTMAFVLSTVCGSVTTYAQGENTDYIKGDITGDGFVGVEDAVYSALSACKYFITEEVKAALPTLVKFNQEAVDVDGDGENSLNDTFGILKAVTGHEQWAKGSHKITSSDKAEVVYKYDGEFVTASVSVEKLADTAVVYDTTKVEFVEFSYNLNKNGEEAMGAINVNEELGFVDVATVCPFDFDKSDNVEFGTVDIKFKVKKDVNEVTFGSCTGGGYIQDNLEAGESFTDAAKRYEEALYTESNVKTVSISLSNAQQILKQALNITGIPSVNTESLDLNSDGKVTLDDAQLALKVALKIVSVEELS